MAIVIILLTVFFISLAYPSLLYLDVAYIIIVLFIIAKIPLDKIAKIEPFAGRAIIILKFKNYIYNKIRIAIFILAVIFNLNDILTSILRIPNHN